jgi:uncharacterized protein YvpB
MFKLSALLLLSSLFLVGCGASATLTAAHPTPVSTSYAPSTSVVPAHPHVASARSLVATATVNAAHLSWVAPANAHLGFYLTATPGDLAQSLAPTVTSADFKSLIGGQTYSFSLYTVGDDQVSLPAVITVKVPAPAPKPAPAKPAAVASTTHIIANVPQYYQLPLSCEETATSMALVHQGLHVSTQQILNGLGVDNTPIQFSNGLISHWGDPDKAFVGNVYGSENHAPYGYQANPNALVRVIKSYGGHIVEWSEPGYGPNSISAAEIYRQVALGHPVVAYATWDWHYHTIHYYTDEYGHKIANIYPYDDHVYVVYGVSASSVLVHDPIRGTYWVSKSSFAAAYEFGMAIVLQ